MKKKANRSLGYYRLVAYATTCVIMLLAISAVAAVRAYLSAQTDQVTNEFSPKNFTYTDTQVKEPDENGQKYTIAVDGTLGTLKSSSNDNDKTAYVENPEGNDRKPVFIRVKMVVDYYDSDNINITRQCEGITVTFDQGGTLFNSPYGWTKTSDAWTYDTDTDYYYYNAIVVPGEQTVNIFDKVTINDATEIPSGATVKIRVIADTVQAVSTDDAKWTAKDYSTTEVGTAWGVTPTLPDSREEDQNPVGITWLIGS